MAMADYRCCDICGCKAFYDANLNYSDKSEDSGCGFKPYRLAGKEQPEWGDILERVGDWAVICNTCSETHEVVIQEKSK